MYMSLPVKLVNVAAACYMHVAAWSVYMSLPVKLVNVAAACYMLLPVTCMLLPVTGMLLPGNVHVTAC